MTDNSLLESGVNNVQIQDGSRLNNDQHLSGVMGSVIKFYNKYKFIIYCVLLLIYLLFCISILLIIYYFL